MTVVPVNNPLKIADQCRHHAVRTAIEHILDGCPSEALARLLRSVQTCARLDNRPLDPERVFGRANRLLIELGYEDLGATGVVLAS